MLTCYKLIKMDDDKNKLRLSTYNSHVVYLTLTYEKVVIILKKTLLFYIEHSKSLTYYYHHHHCYYCCKDNYILTWITTFHSAVLSWKLMLVEKHKETFKAFAYFCYVFPKYQFLFDSYSINIVIRNGCNL